MAHPSGRDRFRALLEMGITLLLVVGAALVAGLVMNLFYPQMKILTLLSIQGGLVVVGAVAIMLWWKIPPRRIRLVPPRLVDLPRAVLALLIFMLVNLVFASVVRLFQPEMIASHHEQLGTFGSDLMGDVPLLTLAGMMLFVAFYEEVVARGLLLSQSERLLPGIWLPVVLSSVLFGLGHFYQGWFGVAQTAIAGAVFAWLTIRWGTLWPAIIAHGVLNTASLLALQILG